jgi:hypothetical protein
MTIQNARKRDDNRKTFALFTLGHNKRIIPGRRQIWRLMRKVEVRKLDKTNKTDNCENSRDKPIERIKVGRRSIITVSYS